jgi:hypothetical protein
MFKLLFNSSNFPLVFFFLVFVKLTIFLFVTLFMVDSIYASGNDSNLYHSYAVYQHEAATSIWPVVLRQLNELGIYDRTYISFFTFFISISILPFIFFKSVRLNRCNSSIVRYSSYFIILFSPTILLFSFDLYRDIYIYLFFLFSIWMFKYFLESATPLLKTYYLFFYILFAFVSLLFREYLGLSLIISGALFFFYKSIAKYWRLSLILYFLVLVLAKNFALLNPLLIYRNSFNEGGTTLGIKLLETDSLNFLLLYSYSFILQVFGLFLVNLPALIIFLLESIPFIFALIYIIKNMRYLTEFGIFLIIFFVLYTSIWVLGNDNLGTAIRLRVPSYLSIFACMLIVYQVKLTKFISKG